MLRMLWLCWCRTVQHRGAATPIRSPTYLDAVGVQRAHLCIIVDADASARSAPAGNAGSRPATADTAAQPTAMDGTAFIAISGQLLAGVSPLGMTVMCCCRG